MDCKGLSRECYAKFWERKEARNRHPQPEGLGCWWVVGGESKGYWVEIARSRPEREAEARHSTKFGRHWAGSRPRPNGRAYTTHQSPYDPVPSYWPGYPAFPPRVGPAAPSRWPAEAPGLRPHGLRPYERKWQQTVASRAVTDQMRLSDDPYNNQRIRDLRVHILERRRHSGSLFHDKDEPTTAQFARGVRWAELETIELHRRHDQLRWFIDGSVSINRNTNLEAPAFTADSTYSNATVGDGVVGVGTDSAIADQVGFVFEEVDNTVNRRRRRYNRPLRERRKAGRKPLGERAMTPNERAAKHRNKSVRDPRTFPAGTDQPLALGLAVPAPFSDEKDKR